MIDILKIKDQQLFDDKQEELSDKERKLIQENKELFQLQFETHKGAIVRNLDRANKKIIGNFYRTDNEVKTQIDWLEKDIQEDPKLNQLYQTFLKKIEKIKNPEKKENKKLMGLLQLASSKCIAIMNAEVQKKWKKGDTIEKVLSSSFYRVKNNGIDGVMGPNTTSVFMDILGRDPNLPPFDGTISKILIKKIYEECHPTTPISNIQNPSSPDNNSPDISIRESNIQNPNIQNPNTQNPNIQNPNIDIQLDMPVMKDNLDNIFTKIQEGLSLHATILREEERISGLQTGELQTGKLGCIYEDLTFTENETDTSSTKIIAYKGIVLLKMGIDMHEGKAMFFASYDKQGKTINERSSNEFNEGLILDLVKKKIKEIDEKDKKTPAGGNLNT